MSKKHAEEAPAKTGSRLEGIATKELLLEAQQRIKAAGGDDENAVSGLALSAIDTALRALDELEKRE